MQVLQTNIICNWSNGSIIHIYFTYRRYLEAHPHIRFLGLALTDVYDMPMFTDEEAIDYKPHILVKAELIINNAVILKREIQQGVGLSSSS